MSLSSHKQKVLPRTLSSSFVGKMRGFVSHFNPFGKKKKVQPREYLAGASLGPWTMSIVRDVGKTRVKYPASFPVVL